MGPVDYLMVRFPGNKFTGKIAPELARLEKKGIIRVIDMGRIPPESIQRAEKAIMAKGSV